MHRITFLFSAIALLYPALLPADPAQVLTNHLGYDAFGPKRAVVRGSEADRIESFQVLTYPGGTLVLEGKITAAGAVDRWRDWRFWSLDFSDLQAEGSYVIECPDNGQTLRSFPFRIQKNILERFTLSDVVFYFKSMRSSGANDRADRKIAFQDSNRQPIDAHGGWYDASGDYGIHMSHLDFSNYFNPQQMPLTAYSLGRTRELIEARRDPNYKQILRRLVDETTFGTDFLVRMKAPNGSFYQTINAYTPDKKPEDRRIVRSMAKGFTVRLKATDNRAGGKAETDKGNFEVGYRNGGGFSIAALAIAARSPIGGDFGKATYLKTAEEAFAYLESHNKELTSDGKENIVDDYCALVAASELYRTSKKPIYAAAAERRANSLVDRLTSSGTYVDYWRADGKDRPFFHAVDAGAPVVSLLGYYDLASKATRARILDAVKRSLLFELRTTREVANPFGLARQYVQSKTGERRTSFFYPHDSDTAPWWQGENARLASLSAAARLAAPLFPDDPAFQAQLQAYAADQLNWILGLNPFDASMLQGTGRNNPEYVFFSSWEYKSAPGGICNGITSGFKDEHDIDLNVPYEVTGQDSDWRWAEQWIPHTSWYLLAVAAGKTAAPPPDKALIGYVFCNDKLLQAQDIAAEKLTHVNYAFANIKDGRIVEGFKNDAENFKVLNSLKTRNPKLKILVSVGGWTWSGNFSDVALTKESRKIFSDSAVAFLRQHHLDGLDVDWEYPAQKGMDNINRPEDKENCTALLADLRAALDALGKASGKHYLLTMATGIGDSWLEHTEMQKVAASLDFVNMMAYDMAQGETDPIAAHHAPLFTHPADPKHLSASSGISHFIAAGVPAEKIVLGVPFYGHAWGEVGETEHGLFQPGKKPQVRLHSSFQGIHDDLAGKDGFVRYWDDVSRVPFLYNAASKTFVSYEDEQSVNLKARYVVDRGLAGIMFWQYSGDPEGKLLDAIHKGFQP